ncbi:MAG TPA: alkaline phosphatase family protein [Steroidobacteraceae bacterium]|nr:alkaline phosphatase family protein [Steroidobacteraceae bacterium]
MLGKSFTATAAALLVAGSAVYADSDDGILGTRHEIRHVLLISVDGLHALDLANFVATHPDSNLAALSRHGVTYTNNATSSPSDSFPGLAALVTGGSPVTTGLWYDDTYNRALSPPAQTDGLGNPGGTCPGVIGTNVAWDEAVDKDLTKLDGGGGLNPNFLVRDPKNGCKTVLPHEYLRVNTIFEVVRSAGGLTAWTDKHPSYEWTNGPSGRGVDDFYGPEINSVPVALPQFPGCTPVPFADPTPDDGWTNSFDDIKCYDLLHVAAVLNQIDGFTHDRSRKVGVPALFGTNFQAVSVGEKLAVDPVTGLKGGYTDAIGTPGQALAGELDFIDQSMGKFVQELKVKGLFESTLIIVSAKHGQSPIDGSKRHGIGAGQPAATIGSADAFDISDDGSLIWLTDPSLAPAVVANLSLPANQTALGIQEIFSGQALRNKFDNPGADPRTPDIVLKVNTGVIFTGGSKLSEHGGFNEDDVHTALLVANPVLSHAVVKAAVSNQQVAPTIIKALGLNPDELDAVRKEQIQPLPFLFSGQNDNSVSRY